MQWPLKFILSHQHLLKMLNPSASERDELWCKSGFPPRKHPHPNLLQHHPSQGPLDPPSAGPGLLFSQTLLQGLVAQSSLLHSYLHSCHEVLVLPLIRAQKTLAQDSYGRWAAERVWSLPKSAPGYSAACFSEKVHCTCTPEQGVQGWKQVRTKTP